MGDIVLCDACCGLPLLLPPTVLVLSFVCLFLCSQDWLCLVGFGFVSQDPLCLVGFVFAALRTGFRSFVCFCAVRTGCVCFCAVRTGCV